MATKPRRYNVWVVSHKDEHYNKVVDRFNVSDLTSEENERENKTRKVIRPNVAEFPVSILYPEEVQQERANQLCTYLNRILEIQEEAVKQNTLLDFLKADATGVQK